MFNESYVEDQGPSALYRASRPGHAAGLEELTSPPLEKSGSAASELSLSNFNKAHTNTSQAVVPFSKINNMFFWIL